MPDELADAHDFLLHTREHSPAEYRDSMLSEVPLHRAIVSAWESGTAEGEPRIVP